MMDFGWSELLLVIIVAIFAIGPKQLPDMMFRIGRLVRRMQYMRYNMTRQMEDYLQMGDIRDLQNSAPITPGKTVIGPYAPDEHGRDEAEADSDLPDMDALASPIDGEAKTVAPEETPPEAGNKS